MMTHEHTNTTQFFSKGFSLGGVSHIFHWLSDCAQLQTESTTFYGTHAEGSCWEGIRNIVFVSKLCRQAQFSFSTQNVIWIKINVFSELMDSKGLMTLAGHATKSLSDNEHASTLNHPVLITTFACHQFLHQPLGNLSRFSFNIHNFYYIYQVPVK